ncbi:MAG: hypothetical protein PVJ73_07180, partial [Acidobacteriota bacterium]
MLSLPVRSSATLALALFVLACAEHPGSVPEGRADLGAQIDALADRGTVALGRVQGDPEFPGRRHLR